MKSLGSLKVAIVQDYLHEIGGAEGVVNAIWEIFPQADIYSATCDEEKLHQAGYLNGANIFYPKWKNSVPQRLKKFIHLILIANLPIYFARLNLKKYDLIISSTAHFAKGVRKMRSDQIHISYIHTPPRFLYGYKGEFRKRDLWYWRLLLSPLDFYLRYVDQKFAKRPDYLICNSHEVQNRIKAIYNRDATVINPFAAVKVSEKDFEDAVKSSMSKKANEDSYFLIVSRLVAYKNIDLAIKVCGSRNIPLKIAGTGSSFERLWNLAKEYKSVEMLGFVSDEKKKELYKNCKGVICAVSDEDFGMAPLEPMMFGKPVIALKQAGYLETVNEDVGVFFCELTEDSLSKAIDSFNGMIWNPARIREHAMFFSKDRFKSEFIKFVENTLK